jgi:hypothetical protein
MGPLFGINGLPLPSLLIDMIQQGRWRHPGNETLRRVIPFLKPPMDLLSIQEMQIETEGLFECLKYQSLIPCNLHLVRGSTNITRAAELPWLDIENVIVIAANACPGDDSIIALDYRTGTGDPRVVATFFNEGTLDLEYREAAPSFSRFVEMMRL